MGKLILIVLIVISFSIFKFENINLNQLFYKHLAKNEEMKKLLEINFSGSEELNNANEVFIPDGISNNRTNNNGENAANSNKGFSSFDEENANNSVSTIRSATNLDSRDLLILLEGNIELISMNDKFAITGIVINNFTLTEVMEWKVKVFDGLTDKEKDEFISLVNNRLSRDEINTLEELFDKYIEQMDINEKENIKIVLETYLNQK